MRHGRLTWSPLQLRVSSSIDAGDHGEHGGTLLVAGEAAVGELHRFRAVAAASPIFRLTAMRAQLTSGPRLTVTVYSKDSSFMQI